MKDVQNMTIDELKAFIRNRGFLDDEINLSFPTEHDLREAVKDIRKLSKDDEESEDKEGWDEEDNTELTQDEQKAVHSGEEQKKRRLEMLKELRKKKKGLKLDKSIKDSGSKVTRKEVQSSMEDIAKLLGEGD